MKIAIEVEKVEKNGLIFTQTLTANISETAARIEKIKKKFLCQNLISFRMVFVASKSVHGELRYSQFVNLGRVHSFKL